MSLSSMGKGSTLEVIPKSSECLNNKNSLKCQKGQKKAKTKVSYIGKKNKHFSCHGIGNGFFLPLSEIFFWPFFAEKGREGLKHPFLVKKKEWDIFF